MQASTTRPESTSLFAAARQIIAQREAQPDEAEPVPTVDIKPGIERALKRSRLNAEAPSSIAEAAARGVATVEGTVIAIDTIREYLEEALELVAQAGATRDSEKRAMIADRYGELLSHIDTVAAAARFEGLNLIDASRDCFTIDLPAAGQPRHEIGHVSLVTGARGLALRQAPTQFASDGEIAAARDALLAAITRLERATQTFLNEASVLAPFLVTRPRH